MGHNEYNETHGSSERINGQFFNVEFNDPDSLIDFIQTSDLPAVLYQDNDMLPEIIDTADIMMHEKQDERGPFSAHISPNKSLLRKGDWGSKLYGSLARTSAETFQAQNIHHIPSDTNGIYIQTDQSHVVRTGFYTSFDRLDITFEMIDANKFFAAYFDALDQNISTEDIDAMYPTEPATYAALKNLTYIWNGVLNDIVKQFGSGSDKMYTPMRLEVAAPQKEIEEIQELSAEAIDEITFKNKPTFEEIGGLTTAKQRLQELTRIHQNKELAKKYGISGGHFILHGPAGTGKTSLIQAFANSIKDADIREIDSTKILDMWVGNSAKHVNSIFDEAEVASQDGPVVLFFDEFDALASNRGGSNEHLSARNILKQRISKLFDNPDSNIIIAAATNAELDTLDPALIRPGRIEPISAPAPNENEAQDIWQKLYHSSLIYLDPEDINDSLILYDDQSNIDFKELAELSVQKEMTGATFSSILQQARMEKFIHAINHDEHQRVTHVDLVRLISEYHRG